MRDERPVFFADVIVDRSGARTVQSIFATFLWAGDPILIPTFNFAKVSLESGTLQATKCFENLLNYRPMRAGPVAEEFHRDLFRARDN